MMGAEAGVGWQGLRALLEGWTKPTPSLPDQLWRCGHRPRSLAAPWDGAGNGKCPTARTRPLSGCPVLCQVEAPGSGPEDAVEEEAPGPALVIPPRSSSTLWLSGAFWGL